MIKAFLQKAGKKLRRITGSNKKQDKQVSSSKQEVQEDQVKKPVLSGNKDITRDIFVQTSKEQAGKTGKYRRPSPEKQIRKPTWTLAKFPVDPVEGKSRFHDFDLPLALMHAIADLDFKYCTPIQEKALPDVLAGKDIIAKASTGTGKSAVFLIALFARLLIQDGEKKPSLKPGFPRALIIAPTRELVMQITKDAQALAKYTPLRIVAVFGGTDYQKQQRILADRPVDVLVATPGRLLDYASKKIINLSHAGIMVIDEADRMLDMGFIPDVRRIIHMTPSKERRQTTLFSATITSEVKDLAAQWCTRPVFIETESEQMAVGTVEQIVYMTTTAEKYNVLYNLINSEEHERIIVFTNMKSEARRLYERLMRNDINCTMLTGDVPQQKRMARLESFRDGKVKVMIATDVAGRGIHIDGISHVVNYTLPYEPEDYVHRIGRTGRAGASGISISFACEEGAFYLPDIEEYIGMTLKSCMPPENLLVEPPKGSRPPKGSSKPPRGSGKGRLSSRYRGKQ